MINFFFPYFGPLLAKITLTPEQLKKLTKICNKKTERPIYTDADGNERCGFMYKQVGDTPYAFVKRECHAVITTPEERVTYEQGDIF